ncbi:profilin [Phakopsora pachyrhizi]|uniref:Profilin n=1 Tax=Phakopsora pachyrhizi TaxID=170000 RepID=A0AAV0BNN7_PHAPC|nr:profilin [Phakopsora pachyrhizi]CAH7687985.1 profilin [Phakopsora pachyrhizi]
MSWQPYVDDNLMGTGYFSDAAILGQLGGVWASSPNFNVTPEEQDSLTKGFDDSEAIQASGIRLANVKYLTIVTNERSIYGKKGGTGCICVKTKQAVVVAVYKAGVQPGEATKAAESFADFLINSGL